MTDKTKMSDYERTLAKAGRVDFTAFQSSLSLSQDHLPALPEAPCEWTFRATLWPLPVRLPYSVHSDTGKLLQLCADGGRNECGCSDPPLTAQEVEGGTSIGRILHLNCYTLLP